MDEDPHDGTCLLKTLEVRRSEEERSSTTLDHRSKATNSYARRAARRPALDRRVTRRAFSARPAPVSIATGSTDLTHASRAGSHFDRNISPASFSERNDRRRGGYGKRSNLCDRPLVRAGRSLKGEYGPEAEQDRLLSGWLLSVAISYAARVHGDTLSIILSRNAGTYFGPGANAADDC